MSLENEFINHSLGKAGAVPRRREVLFLALKKAVKFT